MLSHVLIFHGRLTDSIRRRGENISAFEVEELVSSHPEVLEAAAVGVPSELSEEDVLICVVRRPGSSLKPVSDRLMPVSCSVSGERVLPPVHTPTDARTRRALR